MHHYAVSFVIKNDTTYGERYNSLMEQIEKGSIETTWDETTSFVLVTNNEKIEAFADRLYIQSQINATKDILLVIDHDNNVAVARGPIKYPNLLKSHFKQCLVK
jgi:hypothetical protein